MKDEPIFVVGVQRSGTTLLAAMLAAHSRLSCGPETHFFRWLSSVDARELCDRETWPAPAVEFLESITFAGATTAGGRKSLVEKYQVETNAVAAYLRHCEPAVPHVLRSVTEQYMAIRGKERWVEKTPDHLAHVKLIRKYFPDSPIIRIVRDPRDVALALMNVPWGAKSFLEGLLHWKRLHRTSAHFFENDPSCYTLRFEDLVATPAPELRRLCRVIGEDFEESMLDTSGTGKEINSQNVPWKIKVSQALDVSRLAVWRTQLTRQQNQLAEAVLGDQIAAFGYSREERFHSAGEIRPGMAAAARYENGLETLASRGVRFWKAKSNERIRATVYLGEPGAREWLGDQRAARLMKALPILVDVARAAVSTNHVYWIPDGEDHKWRGIVSFVLRTCLSPYKLCANASGPNHS